MDEKIKQLRPSNRLEMTQKYRLYKEEFLYNTDESIPSKNRTAVNSGLETYTGPWNDIHIGHLLKRTLFGLDKVALNDFRRDTLSGALGTLLTPVPLPAPPVNNYNDPSQGITDPNTPFGQSWIEAPYDNDFEALKILSLKGWIIKNMLQSPLSMHHKMTFFWHNLLVTQFWDVFQAKASYQYYSFLHENAFGNFREMIKGITKDPAMLIYLNGARNNKSAPDENYARELQELFCIGKGPNSQYTEGDVQEAAKVLTGWTVDPDTFTNEGPVKSLFFPPFHETSNKTFSSFYDNGTIGGQEGDEGALELDQMLGLIFDNEETALYICRRIYNFFVYNIIDEVTETQVIQPLAEIFRNSQYEILPVIQALFESAHFHDPSNHGVLIKNPVDYAFSLVKTLDIQVLDGDLQNEFITLNGLNYNMSRLGLEIGDPPSVAGWPAYHQEPQYDRSWITTDSITKRAESSDVIVRYGFFASSELSYATDLIAWVSSFDNPSDPNQLLQEAGILLHGIALSTTSFEMIKSILLGGQEGDHHWTIAWNSYLNNTTDTELRAVVDNRLKATFTAFMQQGEFQLM